MAQHASTDIQLKTVVLPMVDGSNQKYYIGYDSDDIVNLSNVQGANVTEALNNLSGDIARSFDPNQDYSAGQLVIYQGVLYQFINDHTAGPWDSSDVEQTTLGEKIEPLVAQCYVTIMLETADNESLPWQSDSIIVTVEDRNSLEQIYVTSYAGQPITVPVEYGTTYRFSSSAVNGYWNIPSVTAVIKDLTTTVVLRYETVDSIDTFPKAKAALEAGADLSTAVGNQLTTTKDGQSLVWDIVDYDNVNNEITLMLHDLVFNGSPYYPSNNYASLFDDRRALLYVSSTLASGNYYIMRTNDSRKCYFTITQSLPVGSLIFICSSSNGNADSFFVLASNASATEIMSGSVIVDVLADATNILTSSSVIVCNAVSGSDVTTSYAQCYKSANNIGESYLFKWLNSYVAVGDIISQTAVSYPVTVSVPGFLNNFTQTDLDCIEDTNWPCASNKVYELPASLGGCSVVSSVYYITGKFCVPSRKEIFGSNASGAIDDTTSQFDLYVGSSNGDRIKYCYLVDSGGTTPRTCYWYLRSPNPNYNFYLSTVKTDGSISGNSYGGGTSSLYFGIAPICKISGGTSIGD